MQQRDSAMHPECWPAITALSTFFYTNSAATPASHVLCAIHANRRKHTQKKTHTERDEMKTKQLLKISAAPAGVFCALVFSRRPRLRLRLRSTIAAPILRECEAAVIPPWSNARRWLPAAAPIVTRIHSRRAPAPKPAAARRAAAPMPISRSARLRKAQGSQLSTNRTATARSID